MSANVSYIVDASTRGDFLTRDVYARNVFCRGTSNITKADFVISGNSYVNGTTIVSNVVGNANTGAYSVFVKGASNINIGSDTPALQLNTNGAVIPSQLTINTTTLFANTAQLTITPPTLSPNLVIVGNGANITASNGALSIDSTLTVSGDSLLVGDVRVAGTTKAFGDFFANANVTLGQGQVLMGNSLSDLSNTGFYFGNTISGASASLLYNSNTSIESSASFLSSIPLVYKGASATAELGNGGVATVYQNSNVANYTAINPDSVNINGKFRMRYDSSSAALVFEYYTGSAWVIKQTINSS